MIRTVTEPNHTDTRPPKRPTEAWLDWLAGVRRARKEQRAK